jgi:uncharacterized membrane protein YjgN (DUF898 family)
MESAPPAADAPRRHPIEFTATGSEYFRIWIVNLLLTLMTLGLYLPWARVRKFQYFYRNTWVDGDALDFHGNPRRMLRGMLIAAVFLIVYSAGGYFSGWIALVVALAFVGLWPALFRAMMRFRLANTSWRGLRFRFTGDTAGAYACLAPPLALMLIPTAMIGMLAPTDGELDPDAALPGIMPWVVGFYVSCLIAFVIALPYFLWRIRRYQHDNYNLGDQRVRLDVDLGVLYGVFIKATGVGFLSVAVLAVIVVIGVAAGVMAGKGDGGRTAGVAIIFAASVAAILVLNILQKSYLQVRLQNLFWSKTGNEALRFQSDLRLAPYLWLQCKNYPLIFLTLGLYWPFAVVHTRRAQIQAVELRSWIGLDQITQIAEPENPAAVGDMAADLFDFDIGI